MTLKAAALSALLAVVPGLALALCAGEPMSTASACAEGMVWDESSRTCTAPVSS